MKDLAALALVLLPLGVTVMEIFAAAGSSEIPVQGGAGPNDHDSPGGHEAMTGGTAIPRVP